MPSSTSTHPLVRCLTGLVAVAALVHAGDFNFKEKFGHKQAHHLAPIKARDLAATAGLRRRSQRVELSQLDLQTQLRMLYGTPGGEFLLSCISSSMVGDTDSNTADDQLLMAEMTMFADERRPLLMLERFEPYTSSVDCNADDGILSMTFASKDAFDRAVQSWEVINDNEEDSFVLIANHDSCAAQDQDDRQPFLYVIRPLKNFWMFGSTDSGATVSQT